MERDAGLSTGAKTWDHWWRVPSPLFEFLEGQPWETRASELRAKEVAWSKTFAPKDHEALEEAARFLRGSVFLIPAPLALFVVEQLARDYLRELEDYRNGPRWSELHRVCEGLRELLKDAHPATLRYLALPEDYPDIIKRKILTLAKDEFADRGGSASGHQDRTGGKPRRHLASNAFHLLHALELPCSAKGDLPKLLEQIHRAATGELTTEWVRHVAAEISVTERKHAPWLREKPHRA